MEPILLQTSEEDRGARLDAFLARAMEDLTRSAAAKAIEEGRVLVSGKVPSKSNCYKIVVVNGHASLAKQKGLKDYEKSFYLQCDKYRGRFITGLFAIRMKVYYDSQRPDLDNCFKIILDCLQSCKAVKNDRNCVRITAEKFVDKANPRVEFELEEVV